MRHVVVKLVVMVAEAEPHDDERIAMAVTRHLERMPGLSIRGTKQELSMSEDECLRVEVTAQGVTCEELDKKLTEGRHAGKMLSDVWRTDPKYACWLASRDPDILDIVRRW